VSDLATLQGLHSLQALSLDDCTGLKDRERQIADLKKALPNCRIHSSPEMNQKARRQSEGG
jgi:hypothetical protein